MAGDDVPPPPPPAVGQHFTSDQWKAITGFFGNATIPENRLNGKFDVFSWIIDTGATHHVTGEKSWLFDVHTVDCLLVCLMVTRCLLLWKVLFDCQIKSPYIMSFMCLIYVATYSPSPNLLIIYILLSLLILICVLFRTH